METVRIIYEKGVAARRWVDGTWRFEATIGNPLPVDDLSSRARQYGLRPVIMAQYDEVLEADLLLTTTGESFQLLSQQFLSSTLASRNFGYDIRCLEYSVNAVGFHCARLAELSAETCRVASNLHNKFGILAKEGLNVLAGRPTAYYEFDALITAARRVYDSLRFPLWRVFSGKRRGVPRSLGDALTTLGPSLPDGLRERLEMSWADHGTQLKEYRDCIAHYWPVAWGLGQARVAELDGGVLSATFLIPENPEARSAQRFRFNPALDALSYGWKVTSDLLSLAIDFINALPVRQWREQNTKEEPTSK